MIDLQRLDIVEVHEFMQQNKVTPVDLVKACFQQIEDYDAEIKAWCKVEKQKALEAAKLLTEEWQEGNIRGPLHGIPIGVKDTFDVADFSTKMGSAIFDTSPIKSTNATVIQTLEDAGAIILGKTSTTAFAYYDPSPTRNPFNVNHTPGGSSSGSAAAVAANMAFMTVGAQTNASITRPAAYCGIYGYKASTNHFSKDGVGPLAPTFDSIGFFGKTMKDIVTSVGSMTDNRALEAKPIKKLGVVEDPLYATAAKDVLAHRETVISRLKAAGITVESVSLPYHFKEIIETHYTIMAYEAAQIYADLVKKH